MDWKQLGTKVRRSRRGADLTQHQLASQVGVHFVTISRIENAHQPGLTISLLERIANALEVELYEFIGRNGV